MSDTYNQGHLSTQEILSAIGQLSPVELEKVAHRVSQLRVRKGTGQEAELVRIVRRRRPRAFQRRYTELIRKRQLEILSDAEYQELLNMTAAANAFDASRIMALGTLAELRHTDIDTLIRDLGVTTHG